MLPTDGLHHQISIQHQRPNPRLIDMAPFGPWADIPPKPLALVGNGLHLLEFYCRARGVCTAWRAALPPPVPSLVIVTIPPPGASSLYRHFPEVFALFLPAERLFPLTTFRDRKSTRLNSSHLRQSRMPSSA